ncbi:MAG TPA: hypothetical protein VJI13_01060 [Candidatus Norongarragalinales archaeon]|nr:hypothetical protein [Candidatus Norongarragalinales archaeon]
MGNLNIDLEGYPGRVVEFMIKNGFVKTKTEALRLALFEFDQMHSVVPDEDTAYALVAQKLLEDVESGKVKLKKFDFKMLD